MVFLQAEYDPFENRQYTLKYDQRKRDRTNHEGIVDPLMEQLEKVHEQHEGREHLLEGGGLISDLPVNMWDKVYATPHGAASPPPFAQPIVTTTCFLALQVMLRKPLPISSGQKTPRRSRGSKSEARAMG